MSSVDQDLVRVFVLLQQPADRIACYSSIREQFIDLLAPQTKSVMDEDNLMWRLLQLRKRRMLPALHRGGAH